MRSISLTAAVLAGLLLPATAALAAPPASTDVAIKTTAGTIVVRLDAAHAPATVKNFLHYVDAHGYDNATFYRTVRRATEPESRIEVIQGGLNPQIDNPMTPKLTLEPTSKTGLHNVDGTIAMARTADPNSATTEFFLDVGDNRFLDAGGPTGPGYAAFGKVIRGMDVVLKIHRSPSTGETLAPPIRILTVTRVR